MKKLLAILFASALIYSCGSNDASKSADSAKAADTAKPTTPIPEAGTVSVADTKGLELIGSNDCTTCHAIDHKIIGPAYIDVSKKYEATDAVVDSLVLKVKKGGSGNWGAIPMTPHPDLSADDAKTMVKYILSLKNKK
ncbi:MAG: c-type cytochrome [Chitinophagaceae bacterium]|nr:c-type cytochrome [Chitinophagaceae bacterium]